MREMPSRRSEEYKLRPSLPGWACSRGARGVRCEEYPHGVRGSHTFELHAVGVQSRLAEPDRDFGVRWNGSKFLASMLGDGRRLRTQQIIAVGRRLCCGESTALEHG
jgi:hypothetical protein